ncbi:hypothetical protein OAF24_02755 [bacterium]|jgi:hypothetical protein|nr:hypothetical protein [bacterium]MDB4679512.1 hypothetical protein [Planctomycetaceae bacterium]
MNDPIPYCGHRTLEDWHRSQRLTGERRVDRIYYLILLVIAFSTATLMYLNRESDYTLEFMLAFLSSLGAFFITGWHFKWIIWNHQQRTQNAKEQKSWFVLEEGNISEEGLSYRYHEEHWRVEGFVAWDSFAELLIDDDLLLLFNQNSYKPGTLKQEFFDTDADWQRVLAIIQSHVKERE